MNEQTETTTTNPTTPLEKVEEITPATEKVKETKEEDKQDKDKINQFKVDDSQLKDQTKVSINVVNAKDYMKKEIEKKTNRLKSEAEIKDDVKSTTTSIKDNPLKDDDKSLKALLDGDEIDFVSEIGIDIVDTLAMTILRYISKDTSDANYKISEIKRKRLQKILTKIIAKYKVEMKYEYLFVVAIAASYSTPISNALKMRKAVNEAILKKKEEDAKKGSQTNSRVVVDKPSSLVPNHAKENHSKQPKVPKKVDLRKKFPPGSAEEKEQMEYRKYAGKDRPEDVLEIIENKLNPEDEKEHIESVSFEELEKVSKEDKALVDLKANEEAIAAAKASLPKINRKRGGQAVS